MLQAIPTAPTPQPPRLDYRAPANQAAIDWLDAHRNDAELGRIIGRFDRRQYAVLVHFVSWALAHNALTKRRTKAASIRLDDAEALEAAAKAWLHAQVQTSADLFAWLLRQADQHHVDFYVVYTFVAWGLTAGRLKNAARFGEAV